jgi:SAM-dependent methyltransferase
VACPGCGAEYGEDEGVLDLVVGREGLPGFDPHYFSALAEVQDRHFWFVGRRQVILEAMQRTVPDLADRSLFDIGCGSGGLLRFLGESGVSVAGACDAYLESLRLVRRHLAAPLARVDEGRLPPLAPGLTLVGLFDVLEHIDDDEGTLHFLRSVLEPGGYLALTVPAHPFLFDEMDELAHHRRRYRRADLQGKLEAAGFEVRALTHFMAPLVPALMVARGLGRLLARARISAAARRSAELRVTPGLNGFMAATLAAERGLLRAGVRLPFGSSLLALARRPSGS